MNEMRKKVIIQEIIYWKKNRLLPDQYCDYLLALYSGGEEVKSCTNLTKTTNYLYSIIGLLLLLTLFLNYFTQLAVGLQMGLTYFLLFALISCTIFFYKKKFYYHFPLIGSAIVLLLVTIRTADFIASEQVIVLYILLIVNCLIWLVLGKKLNLIYFLVSGFLGLTTIIYFIAKLYSIF
ncbi:hypothetical protein [Peribacillus huizhouensis]|uniref:DUF4401 domain-containing protein n=1 Tax=Peribacillus huizhouensis TaxID=1501239 RepID=A0ABR6CK76_9BACI|nr:hypothetical protein [Peribacillus huizhouensis]MBA9025462.1 hypothetical protein [Peribacillus huizhouensis]